MEEVLDWEGGGEGKEGQNRTIENKKMKEKNEGK